MEHQAGTITPRTVSEEHVETQNSSTHATEASEVSHALPIATRRQAYSIPQTGPEEEWSLRDWWVMANCPNIEPAITALCSDRHIKKIIKNMSDWSLKRYFLEYCLDKCDWEHKPKNVRILAAILKTTINKVMPITSGCNVTTQGLKCTSDLNDTERAYGAEAGHGGAAAKYDVSRGAKDRDAYFASNGYTNNATGKMIVTGRLTVNGHLALRPDTNSLRLYGGALEPHRASEQALRRRAWTVDRGDSPHDVNVPAELVTVYGHHETPGRYAHQDMNTDIQEKYRAALDKSSFTIAAYLDNIAAHVGAGIDAQDIINAINCAKELIAEVDPDAYERLEIDGEIVSGPEAQSPGQTMMNDDQLQCAVEKIRQRIAEPVRAASQGDTTDDASSQQQGDRDSTAENRRDSTPTASELSVNSQDMEEERNHRPSPVRVGFVADEETQISGKCGNCCIIA